MKKILFAIGVLALFSNLGCAMKSPHKAIGAASVKVGQTVKNAAVKTSDSVGSGFKKTADVVSSGFVKTVDFVTHPFHSEEKQEDQLEDYLKEDNEESFTKLVDEVEVYKVADYSTIERPAQGNVVRKELLSSFGAILLLPFKPGVGIVDDDQIDSIALRITRGISEVLINENKSGFYEILFNENKNQADYEINGSIVKLKDSSLFQSLTPASKKITLGIKGQMRDVASGEVVLSFHDEITFRKDQIEFKALADIMGQNIARYILSNL